MRLILGNLDIAYSSPGTGTATTGEVAQYLEDKYHPYEIFVEERLEKIGEWLAESMADALLDVLNGAPIPPDPFLDAEENIQASFRQFLDTGEIEKINPQTPTQAALEGRTKRRKNQKGPRRPSLIDTGEYRATARAVVEGWREAIAGTP